MAKKNYIAEGYPSVVPSLAFNNTSEAINWYSDVLDAKEKMKMENPDKTIGHAELSIGDSVVFLADENPQYNKTPKTAGGNSIQLHVYVPEVDATLKKAVDKGAKLLRQAEDMFYGDRVGQIQDPFGYQWTLATHVKDVSEAELKKGMVEAARKMEEMAHS